MVEQIYLKCNEIAHLTFWEFSGCLSKTTPPAEFRSVINDFTRKWDGSNCKHLTMEQPL